MVVGDRSKLGLLPALGDGKKSKRKMRGDRERGGLFLYFCSWCLSLRTILSLFYEL